MAEPWPRGIRNPRVDPWSRDRFELGTSGAAGAQPQGARLLSASMFFRDAAKRQGRQKASTLRQAGVRKAHFEE